jgi:diguanylate cyclase (GGDEF)-like protein
VNAEQIATEHDRPTWFRHALFAMIGNGVHTLICLGYFLGGYFRTSTLGFIALFGVAWLGNVAMLHMIRSGYSGRFRDPALTAALMSWSTVFIVASAYFVDVGDLAGGTRLSLMMMFFGVLLLGSFRLQKRTFYVIATLANLGYAWVLFEAFTDPEISKTVTESVEIVQFVMFLVLTFVFARAGAEISLLQNSLATQNKELETQHARIQELAIRDELTGLHNRRHVMTVLRDQKLLSDSGGYDFVVGYIDLDHFKRINDTWGHGVGDIVLKRCAAILLQSVREVDYAGRLGGEEFIVILTRTRLSEALVVTERIRAAMEACDFSDVQSGLHVTCSIGVTAYQGGEALEDMLSRSDGFLYEAKQGGRNRVVSGEAVLRAVTA